MDIEKNKKKVIKDEWIKVRVSLEGKKDILAKAETSGRSVSDLIRIAIEKSKAPTLTNIKNEQRLIREIARIGNNLNQVARICNTLKSDVDGFELLVVLKSIEAEVQALSLANSNFFSPTAPFLPANGEMANYVD